MANTITFGQVETRIRRDMLNDNVEGSYRWSLLQVMAAINMAVVDIVERYNSWAGYSSSGVRLKSVHTALVENSCQLEPTAQKVKDGVEDAKGSAYTQLASQLRASLIPIDDRYYDAIALIAAGRLLQLDDTDTENAQKASSLLEMGKEYALR